MTARDPDRHSVRPACEQYKQVGNLQSCKGSYDGVAGPPPNREFLLQAQAIPRIATRYDKTARNFLAAIHLAAAIIWLN
ncbi:hypothetical protein ACVWXO_001594 [Bradyrhizobium sp. LM2.7]